MNIKADHPVNLPATLASNGESNIVYIDRRSFEGKLRYVILDGANEIIGVADERDLDLTAGGPAGRACRAARGRGFLPRG